MTDSSLVWAARSSSELDRVKATYCKMQHRIKGLGTSGQPVKSSYKGQTSLISPANLRGTSTRAKGDEGLVEHIPNANIFHSGSGYAPSPHRVHYGAPIVDIEARDHQ
jgi:hypothetical protein